jgi:hypothetical protein
LVRPSAAIQQIAGRLFATRGDNGTSLHEVADGMGLSPAALLHHYPDKPACGPLSRTSIGAACTGLAHLARQTAVNVSALRDGLNLQWLLAPDEVDMVATIRGSFLPYVDLDLG